MRGVFLCKFRRESQPLRSEFCKPVSYEEYEAGTIPLKILDIDADGNVDALTDGLIIIRYLFGLRGQALINGAIADNALRTEAADVEAYIQSLMPGF